VVLSAGCQSACTRLRVENRCTATAPEREERAAGDWYFRIGFFENYDSQPPSDLSKNDWGWSNAFGFKF
jgi:hypothetical protein